MVLIPEKAVLLTPLKTKWPLWPYYGQIWPNMCLITIFGEDNFTSQFLCKKGGNSRKSSLIDPLKTKWPFLAILMAILWPNLAKYGFNYNFG